MGNLRAPHFRSEDWFHGEYLKNYKPYDRSERRL